jgi:hypothetical protein
METNNEPAAAAVAKAALPIGVSMATVFGYPISDVLVWCTLIYTLLMIIHKVYLMYKDFKK